MCVVVTDCAIDLAEELATIENHQLTSQPGHDIGDLLAHGRGARGLAVGARQHGSVSAALGQHDQRVHHTFHFRYQHCVDAITTEVTKVAGVTAVSVDLDAKTVAVDGGDDSAITAAIDEAGYDVA